MVVMNSRLTLKRYHRVYLTSKKAHREVMNVLVHHSRALHAALTGIRAIMSKFDDLTAAVTDMSAAVNEGIAEMEKELALIAGNPADTTAVTDSTAKLTALAATIRAEIAKIETPPTT